MAQSGMEQAARSAPPTPSRIMPLLPAAVVILSLIAVFVYAYAPALRLPVSLIDDEAHLANSERFWRNVQDAGWLAALKQDDSVRNRMMNTGFELFSGVMYQLTDGAPYHGWKLVSLALVVLGLLLLPWVAGPAGGGCGPLRAWLCGGATAAFLLLLGEVPGAMDLQSLRANWYRLHTTDSAAMAFIGLFLPLLFAALAARRAVAWLRAAGCVLLLVAAISMKSTMAVVIGPLLLLGGILYMGGSRREAVITVSIAGGAAVPALLYFAFLKSLMSTEAKAYGSSFDLSPANLASGTRYYVTAYWNMLGPLCLWFPLAMSARLLHERRTAPGSCRGLLLRNAPLLFLLALFLALTAVYVPWMHRLPRYMLPGYIILCAAFGLEVTSQLIWLRTLPVGRPSRWLLVGAVSILILPLKLLPLAAAAVAWCSGTPEHRYRFPLWAAGLGLVGFLYFVMAGLLSVSALKASYVDREIQQARATSHVESVTRSQRTLGFLGDAGDEHIGSMVGILARRGVIPEIRSVYRVTDTSGVDVLLDAGPLTPEDVRRQFSDWKPLARFGPRAGTTNVPVTFWQWRGRLWREETVSPSTPVTLRHSWIFLAPPSAPHPAA